MLLMGRDVGLLIQKTLKCLQLYFGAVHDKCEVQFLIKKRKPVFL